MVVHVFIHHPVTELMENIITPLAYIIFKAQDNPWKRKKYKIWKTEGKTGNGKGIALFNGIRYKCQSSPLHQDMQVRLGRQ